jgi:hypothetical protein
MSFKEKLKDWVKQEKENIARFAHDVAGLFSEQQRLGGFFDDLYRSISHEEILQRVNGYSDKWWNGDEPDRLTKADEVLEVCDSIYQNGALSAYAPGRTSSVWGVLGRFLLWPLGFFLAPIVVFFGWPIFAVVDERPFYRGKLIGQLIVLSPLWIPALAIACALGFVLAALATVVSVFYFPFVDLPRKLGLRQNIEKFEKKYKGEGIKQCRWLVDQNVLKEERMRMEEAIQKRNKEAGFDVSWMDEKMPEEEPDEKQNLITKADRLVPGVHLLYQPRAAESKPHAVAARAPLTLKQLKAYQTAHPKKKNVQACIDFLFDRDGRSKVSEWAFEEKRYLDLREPYYVELQMPKDVGLSIRYQVHEKAPLLAHWRSSADVDLDLSDKTLDLKYFYGTEYVAVVSHGDGFPPMIQQVMMDVHEWLDVQALKMSAEVRLSLGR